MNEAQLQSAVTSLSGAAAADTQQYTSALQQGDGESASQWLTAFTLTTEALRSAHNALVAASGGKSGLYQVPSP
jgi:hypothetical protein